MILFCLLSTPVIWQICLVQRIVVRYYQQTRRELQSSRMRDLTTSQHFAQPHGPVSAISYLTELKLCTRADIQALFFPLSTKYPKRSKQHEIKAYGKIRSETWWCCKLEVKSENSGQSESMQIFKRQPSKR